MSQIDALNAVKNVKRRLIDHALEEHNVKDVQVRDACQCIWEGSPDAGGLVSDLWVEGAFPSKTGGSSLNERVENGSFSPRLRDLLDKNLQDRQAGYGADWTPRLHQAESMDEAAAGYAAPDKPAIVVTAGTGAGKTEAFLLPMLNDVFTHPREIGEGVSCIILYPLNALVKDQVDRLHGWLYGQKECRLFSFTGETPEDRDELKRDRLPRHYDGSRLSTRQEARGREKSDDKLTRLPLEQQDLSQVPEILVTNYSMLEYMLSRPQDRVFFGKNLRTIILDEAHLYRGNLAAEIAMLLRRVMLRCGLRSQDVVHFATSATIGKSGEEGKKMLQHFASQLFSKPEQDVKVIQGQFEEETLDSEAAKQERDPQPEDLASIEWPKESLLESLMEGEKEFTQFFLCNNEDEWSRWENVLRQLRPAEEVIKAIAEAKKDGHVAPMLAKLLPRVGIMQKLYHALFARDGSKRLPLSELAHLLFGKSDDIAVRAKATQRLLQIGALARKRPEQLPFLPNRIHALLRAPEGLSFCFDPDREVSPERRIPGLGYFFSPGQMAKLNTGEKACLSVCRCKQSGRWLLAGILDDDGKIREVPARLTWRIDQQIDLDEEDDSGKTLSDKIYFYLPPSEQLPDGMECQTQWLDTATSMIGGDVPGRTRLILVKQCPDTGEDLMKLKAVRFFSTASRLSLSIAAESLLVEMPPVPGARAKWLPARGRRLLAFSDSRSEAARLGPRLQETHESQMIRAAIAREVGAGPKKEIEILKQDIEDFTAMNSERYKDRIANAHAKIQELSVGFDVTELLRSLPQSQHFLSQLMDFESAKLHDVSKHAWSQKHWEENQSEATKPEKIKRLIAVELSRRPSWPRPSLETTGVVEVCYPGLSDVTPPDRFLDGLRSDHEREQYRNVWPHFLALLCDELRNKGAITTRDEGYDPVGDDYDESRQLGKWASLDDKYWKLIPLIPQREDTRMGRFLLEIVRQIEGAQRASLGTGARELLTAGFDCLCDSKAKLPWLECDERQTGSNKDVKAVRILFRQLRFRAPIELHQCELTGQVWPRAIYLEASQPGLVPATAKVAMRPVLDEKLLDQDARIGRRRRDWRESEVFTLGIWAQEHSAQQDIKENARLQNLFKAGVRNVLSATTTLELGIDIGGLSGVLMGNLPPGKANYLQRAGRAGRRADGSSLVCGFARSSPYEREAFLHFAEYLNQDLPPPTVFLHREKIVRRHIHAFLLGEWSKLGWKEDEVKNGNRVYGEMLLFTGHQEIPGWPEKDNWEAMGGERKIAPLKDDMPPPDSPALRFRNYIESLDEPEWLADLKGTNEVLCQSNWPEIRREAIHQFNSALKSWIKDYNELCSCWNEVIGLKQSQTAMKLSSAGWAIKKQADALAELTVIEALGNALYIPRYGFPIGISKLIVREFVEKGRMRTMDQFKLERDSIMAMREYVPGSQILVGGQRITSHGISKHWTGENVKDSTMILRGHFKEGVDGRFEFNRTSKSIPGKEQLHEMLFPKHGFVTAAWDPPVKSSAVDRIGRAETRANAFSEGARPEDVSDFAEITGVVARFREGKELVVLNKGDHKQGFAVCLRCGYAESEEHAPPDKLDQKLPKGFDKHQSLTSKPAPGEKIRWCRAKDAARPIRHQVLAATQITNFFMLDFSSCLAASDRELAITVAQALRLAGARLLHLDPRELRTLEPLPGISNQRGLAVVLYDSLAGGSGHVEELMRLGRAWLEETVRLLSVVGGSNADKTREAVRRLLTPETLDQDVDFTFKPLEARDFLVKLMAGELNTVSFNPPPAAPQPPPASALKKPSPPRKKQGSPSGASIKEQPLTTGELPGKMEWVIAEHPKLPGGRLEGKWWHQPFTDKAKPHRVRLLNSSDDRTFEMSDAEFKQIKFRRIQPPA